ncbi:MAG: alpha-L-fucosidase [Bacteroidales bacterium]|nr:alpha-L-fucosidase [Bacteroidales bacterium]
MRHYFAPILLATILTAFSCQTRPAAETVDTRSPQEILFEDGNYAMFIHFGLYSKLEGVWKDKIYYGNAEWIMNSAQAGIPVDEYMAQAASFNPSEFDADAIVSLAKEAGMKYIIITSKHHEGFAMFDTAASDFDIVDATPLKRDLMAELAEACHREGLGIGFYYSQFQDWTAPGGGYGPTRDASGREVSFDEYFRTKCVPQVEELTTKYGDIQLIWFDTPGDMSAEYSKELVDIVRKNQPHALVSSRVGNGMGDYETLGDMEVPVANYPGRWEGIDVTQVGWGYSRYDNEWKSPDFIVRTLVSTIARGGTWMLNVGPDSKGRIHPMAAAALRASGKWVHAHPEAVYGAGPSPWGHALPWGDAVTQGDKVELVVFDWPSDGNLWVPGLKTPVKSVRLGGRKLRFTSEKGWVRINVPFQKPEEYASVIELSFDSVDGPDVDGTLAADPIGTTVFPVEFASVSGCEIKRSGWMEKFGEWKTRNVAQGLSGESSVKWTVLIKDPGVYNIDLEYLGMVPDGWVEWRIAIDGTEAVVNEHDATRAYAWYPMGWVKIDSPGIHTFTLRATGGDIPSARVAAMRLTPIPM